MGRRLNRRLFLGSTSAGLVTALGCRGARQAPALEPQSSAAAVPTSTTQPAGSGITAEVLAAAEKVARVEYTDKERTMLVEDIDNLVELIDRRRSMDIARTDPPALVFDPLLPGRTIAAGRSRVKLPRLPRRTLPKDDVEIAFAPLAQLSDWIRRRQLSSVRLTEIYQKRLRALGPKLECTITETPKLAASQAASADSEIARGRYRGPLHGIPYGAKDLFDTAGIATTYGATPFKNRVASVDATVIQRLQKAGAVLIAKTTLGALAQGDVWFGGRTRNPWNTIEGSSGSSAGSAAGVAAGLFGFALGTETLGSIVSPCTSCGSTGLRPTFGRVPRGGAMPLCWSMDKIGPICRSVSGTAMVLKAIAGADAGDPASRTASFDVDLSRSTLKGLRVGYDKNAFDASKQQAVLKTVEGRGATLVPVDVSGLATNVLLPILFAEAAAAFEDLTLENKDDELVSQGKDAWPNNFRISRFISAVDLIQADRVRRQAMRELDGLMDPIDVLIAPPRTSLLTTTNFTGQPALVLRSGFARRKPLGEDWKPLESAPEFEAPESIVLYGKLFDEATLCRAGVALEAALGVWDRRPPQAK